MILSDCILKSCLFLTIVCDQMGDECTLFDFTLHDSWDFSKWISVTDQTRGGHSTASIGISSDKVQCDL